MAWLALMGVNDCDSIVPASAKRTVQKKCASVSGYSGFLGSCVGVPSVSLLTEVTIGGGVRLEAIIATAHKCISTNPSIHRKIPLMHIVDIRRTKEYITCVVIEDTIPNANT